MSTMIKPPASAVWQWQRNYHYLRYAILGLFLVAVGTFPTWLASHLVSTKQVAYGGMLLSLLCLIMDMRNYVLYRDEESHIREVLGKPKYSWAIVSWALAFFYLAAFLTFASFSMPPVLAWPVAATALVAVAITLMRRRSDTSIAASFFEPSRVPSLAVPLHDVHAILQAQQSRLAEIEIECREIRMAVTMLHERLGDLALNAQKGSGGSGVTAVLQTLANLGGEVYSTQHLDQRLHEIESRTSALLNEHHKDLQAQLKKVLRRIPVGSE